MSSLNLHGMIDPARWAKYERHPLSAVFGDMPAAELKAMSESIQKDGLLEAISLYEGKIVDGWHRYKACQAVGFPPYFKDLKVRADELPGWLAAKNVHRRHLSAEQRQQISLSVLLADPSKSDREIAAVTKQAKETVAKQREEAGVPKAPEAKKAKVVKVIAENPDASNREIARKTGTDDKTVAKVRKGAENGRRLPNSAPPSTSKQPKPPAKPKVDKVREGTHKFCDWADGQDRSIVIETLAARGYIGEQK